jgi:hypothetical protein
MRKLVYDAAVDAIDEYCLLGESTVLESMKRFVGAVCGCFEAKYLWSPILVNLETQATINFALGFPRMFTSLDCMH